MDFVAKGRRELEKASGTSPKYGHGDIEQEQRCKEFQVLVRISSGLDFGIERAKERFYVNLEKPDATVADVRHRAEVMRAKQLGDVRVLDESDIELKEPDMPLHRLSNQCRASLQYVASDRWLGPKGFLKDSKEFLAR
mmetsp:Transcript_41370/g.119751  ORF Transcript_41370/g.119751 Transcript_41370/m.119751 type:complete len:138 (+) Transcript_41370:90-503(+)